MPESQNNTNVSEVESALAALHPRSSRLDRDEVMYLAGRASCGGTLARVAWPSATIAATLLACIFGTLHFAGQPQTQVAQDNSTRIQSQRLEVAQTQPTEVIVQEGEYWSVRNQLLANESGDGWTQVSVDWAVPNESHDSLRVGSRLQLDQLLEPNHSQKDQS